MIDFTCACGQTLYFENTACLRCGARVGYDPRARRMLPLATGADGIPRGEAGPLCRNGIDFGVCNWIVGAGQNPGGFCLSCRLNQTIPNLRDGSRLHWWKQLELAKRRLIFTLLELNLPVTGQTRIRRRARVPLRRRPALQPGCGGRARLHRPQRRRGDNQPRRGGRGAARNRAPGFGRVVPHRAGPFPPRKRALLFQCAGRPRAAAGAVPGIVRRRNAGLRGGPWRATMPAPESATRNSSAPTPSRIRWRTGPRPGRITCT